MPKFHGFGTCVVCKTDCVSMHFLDVAGERHCLACFTSLANPDHPDIAEMRTAAEAALAEWRCTKWNRDDTKLPNGPQSVNHN
jgi:hypothetical protein